MGNGIGPRAAIFLLLVGLLPAGDGQRAPQAPPSSWPGTTYPADQRTNGVRRVNAPHFAGYVQFSETAIFWFGRVTPSENAVDVRVGYDNFLLYLHIATFDRRLWYNPTPSPGDLTNWDGVTLYLDTDGNVGSAPDTSSYRFDAQLNWWEPRADFQAAYVGDGSGWLAASIPFTTTSGWRGDEPNNDQDDRGWTLAYYLPFASLGLAAPPPPGTVWGLALALHDRDEAPAPPLGDEVWPEAMAPQVPATWGQLAFGLPAYTPPSSRPGGTVTIRHGLEGTTVVDADVGGSSVCGEAAAPDYFAGWGNLNYAGKTFLNIQNQGDGADWPCFSRYYVTFPLDAIPAGQTILSATLTLYQFGNAGQGWEPGPQPSLIQVLTVGEGWEESSLTWNNAPLAVENVAAAWADPLDPLPPWPGVPRQWDVSLAVARAHAAGTPLRLALYESDWAMHSGKYFVTSDTDDWGQAARPTLRVTWGTAAANLLFLPLITK